MLILVATVAIEKATTSGMLRETFRSVCRVANLQLHCTINPCPEGSPEESKMRLGESGKAKCCMKVRLQQNSGGKCTYFDFDYLGNKLG